MSDLAKKRIAWTIILLISIFFVAYPSTSKKLSSHPVIDVGIAYSIWYSLDTIFRKNDDR